VHEHLEERMSATPRTDRRRALPWAVGTALALAAPGSGIVSAWHTASTATATSSGTSMAAPHVTGAAAILLEQDPTAGPAAVSAAVVQRATPRVLSGVGSRSPNLLLRTP
jgi:aqualysin 1